MRYDPWNMKGRVSISYAHKQMNGKGARSKQHVDVLFI